MSTVVAILAKIGAWVAGKGLSTALAELRQARQDRLAAANADARLEHDKQVAFWQGQVQIALAAKDDRWWSPRSIMGTCAAIYVAKIIVWDTVLALGVTPDPGPQVTGIVMVVIGFYFGSKAVSDIGAKLLATFAGRAAR